MCVCVWIMDVWITTKLKAGSSSEEDLAAPFAIEGFGI